MAEFEDKRAMFVREYLIDLNATQAAIRSWYSEKTAYSQGQRLLKDVEIAKAASEFSQLSIELLLNLTCLRNSEIARRNRLAEVTS